MFVSQIIIKYQCREKVLDWEVGDLESSSIITSKPALNTVNFLMEVKYFPTFIAIMHTFLNAAFTESKDIKV